MKQAEMGTDLIDHLSPEEKDLLSRLHPEITELKEKLVACKTERIEVRCSNDIGPINFLWKLKGCLRIRSVFDLLYPTTVI